MLTIFTIAACNNTSQEESVSENPIPEVTSSDDEDVTITVEGGDLKGSLRIPEGDGPFPCVLILAGSGPTDRNCNSPMGLKSDAYKMLADSLEQCGIASLRYDKRGIGESAFEGAKEADLRFDQLVDDAGLAIEMLRTNDKISKIWVLGHSEGSLVGMIACQRNEVDGFISLAGPAQNAGDLLYEQIAKQSQELADLAKPKFDSLRMGMTVAIGDPQLLTLLRSSVQPYMMSWFAYTPTEEIAKLEIPIMMIQGSTDFQVETKEFEQLVLAQTKSTNILVPGMNHVMKDAPADQAGNLATYADPSLPLSQGWIPDLCEFVKSN